MITNIEELEKKAIDLAIANQWKDAIKINKTILKIDKDNLTSLLRLGFAYMQSNKLKQAKICYKKALKIQPGNNIAQENLEKIKILEEKKIKNNRQKKTILDPYLFLEIPGKTILSQLVNLGQKNILAQLTIGQKVCLKIRRRKIEVRTDKDQYIGSLPDDLSQRLIFFLKAKSIYSCYIKEVSLKKVVVFIKEEKKGDRVIKFISFPKNLQSNINLLKETEEEDEIIKKDEEIIENEIESLAEKLEENRDYLPSIDLDESEEEDEE